MRAWPLLLLLVIGVGVVYCFVARPAWFEKLLGQAEEVVEKAQGYGNAETPKEAVELFRKAVKARKYVTAAKYCTGKYATALTNSGEGAAELADVLDRIQAYMKDKGLNTDASLLAIRRLHPFPWDFEVKQFAEKDKKGRYVGVFSVKLTSDLTANLQELGQVDAKMFHQTLKPRFLNGVYSFEIVQEKHNDKNTYKLDIPLTKPHDLLIDHFNNNYKSYVTGLSKFRGEMLNNRYSDKEAFQRELFTVLRNAK